MRKMNITPIDLAYVRYQHPDLDLATEFLEDFGFTVAARSNRRVYYRGESALPYIYVVEKGEVAQFIGFGLEVMNLGRLEEITRQDDELEIYNLDGPGGGSAVTLKDPNDFRIDLVCGVEHRDEMEDILLPLPINSYGNKQRLNQPQFIAKQPAKVIRLGHIAIDVLDFNQSYKWYTNLLGMLTSDRVYYGHPTYPVAAFLRCNRGKNYVDHHTIVIAQGSEAKVHHVGCEVRDFDSLQMGHQWLKNKQYEHVWGVGRHRLGSQIFDYWRDPFGSLIEHFSDGDVFNDESPEAVHPGNTNILFQWGGPVPQTFLG